MRAWLLGIVVAAVACAAALITARADTPSTDNRVALVVGIADYGQQSLANPINDARLIQASLANTGFETKLLLNPTRGQLREAVNALAALAASKGRDTTVAFYFAGHAVQFNGENWLLPTGTDLFQGVPSVANFEDGSVRAQWVLDRFSESGVSRVLLILDACRNNPFRADRRSLGEGDGLAKMTGVPGGPDTMIMFAAEPRFPAYDGEQGNSPFSQALAETMAVPGLDIAEIFNLVREQVRGKTNDRQRPHVEGLFRFRFRAGAPVTVVGARSVESQTGIASARLQSAEDGFDLLREYMRTHTVGQLRAAASSGSDGAAIYLLGLAHWDGLYGVEKNPLEAQRLMRRAVALGVARAANSLGFFACCSDEMPKDPAEAVDWFRIAADRGLPGAMNNLGIQYRDGMGAPENRAEAERLFNRAAEAGYALALNNLGWLYADPKYGTVNDARATQYFQRAYDGGYRLAAVTISDSHRYGWRGFQKSPQRAAEILQRGGEAGCKTCWHRLGGMFAGDELGAPDLAAAYRMYQRGAQAEDVDAMVEAARALRTGKGVAENKPEAFRLFERAAALGNLEAKGQMGQALAKGEGVARDPERAARLLREVLAFDLDPDPNRRFRVYEPNYWGYGLTLAELHETRAIAGASADEAKRLRDRYGLGSGMKRFTVPIECGASGKTPFHIYVTNWNRPDDETIEGQVAWLESQRGCRFPADVVESFRKLKKIARENNVSFVDLTVYALGAAQNPPAGLNAPAAAPPAPPPNKWTREANPAPITVTGAALNETAVVLIYGEDARNRPVHSYVKLTLAKLAQLRPKLAARENLDLRTYGEVIASGFGEPDDATKQRMSRERTVADAQRAGR